MLNEVKSAFGGVDGRGMMENGRWLMDDGTAEAL